MQSGRERRGAIRRAALLAALFFVACTGSPTPRFYAIAPLAPVMGEESTGDEPGIAVFVGPVTIPRYLERPQIVLREDATEFDVDQLNRWGGSLESEILRALGQNLSALLGSDRVVVYPQPAPFRTAYGVRLDFEHFEGRKGGPFHMKVRWILQPGQTGEALAVAVSEREEPVEGSGVPALVRAHGAALLELSREIATKIRALEANAPGAAPAG